MVRVRSTSPHHEALGLERARLRLVGVRVEGISDAAGVPHQLALGEKESGWREAEQAVDKASRRFGTGAVRPATLVDPGGEAPASPSSRPPSSRGKRDR